MRPRLHGPGDAPTTFPDDFPKEGVSYTVQRGTLAVIARKTGAKQQDIINANKLADPSRITAGRRSSFPEENNIPCRQHPNPAGRGLGGLIAA